MKLLTPTQPAELPTEALLARLRCRRAAINLSASHVTEVPATDIFCWLYKRLNRRLRKQLEPFLDQHAMRSLILALRQTLAGKVPSATILESSLLAEPLQRLTTNGGDSETTIAQLETSLGNDYPFVSGLTSTYRAQGPGGVEQQLTNGILQHGLARAGKGFPKKMLRYLIDMRNCLIVNKFWRWRINQTPSLTTGGKLATTSLQHIWATNDSDRLTRMVSQMAGEPLKSSEAIGVEQCLLKGLTRLLRRAGRDPLGLAVIVEYLWLAQLAVHNQMLHKALALDREDLLEEVLLL